LGALKKERKEEEREEKDPLSNPSSPQNLQVFKKGMRKKVSQRS
jgi:hypothetical protein